MPSLLDDLDRLAHRGPHADPARVVAAAIDAADAGADQRRRAAGSIDRHRAVGDRRRTERHELDTRSGPSTPVLTLTAARRRRPGAAWAGAAAALVGVGIAAVGLGPGGSPAQPASTGGPASDAAPVAPGPVATTPPPSAADQSLQGMYLTLLDIGNRDEAVAAWSFNRPEQEVAACMAAAGLEYTPGADPAATVAGDSLYALTPADFAAQFGFGILTDRAVAADPGDVANETRQASMTRDERMHWDATARECRTSSDRVAASNALQVALPSIRTKLLADPTMVAALDTWRGCVAAVGYTYDSPLAMRQSFYDRMNSGSPRAELQVEEISMATATLDCNEGYRTAYRDTAIAHVGEFQELYDTALRLELSPEGQG